MAEDEWLFDSIKLYKNLSIYDMQHCVTAMDFVGGGSMCMATQCRTKSQILELELPDKMLDENQSARLKKDRDFHVSAGGFCEKTVTQVKHIPESRLCVLAEIDGEIGVWELGTESSDLIHKVRSLPTVTDGTDHVCMVFKDTADGKLMYGTRLNNFTLVDAETGTCIMNTSGVSSTDHVSSIHHLTSDSFVSCSHNGNIHILDIRSKDVKVVNDCCHGDTASFWTMSKPNTQSNCVYKLSSQGDIHRLDTRCLSRSVKEATIGPGGKADTKYLNVQQNPKGDKFSVSGFGGLVHIYKQSDLDSCTNILEPVFTHEGHVTCCDSEPDSLQVVNHLWHAWVEDLIISTATDCSLHAWQYNT